MWLWVVCSIFYNFGYLSPRTEVVIYVVERSPNGTSRRVPATTLYAHFEQTNIKTQLQQLGVTLSMTRTELSPAQIKQLLQNPPAGMSPESWGWGNEKFGNTCFLYLGSCCLVINVNETSVSLSHLLIWDIGLNVLIVLIHLFNFLYCIANYVC